MEASQLISSSDAIWNLWVESRKIEFITAKWDDNDFDTFMNQTSYPKFLLSADTLTEISRYLSEETRMGAVEGLTTWFNLINPSQVEDGDTYEFRRALRSLSYAWRNLMVQYQYRGRAAHIKAAIDTALTFAFQYRANGNQVYLQAVPITFSGDPRVVRPEAVLRLELPERWSHEIRRLHNYPGDWAATSNGTIPSSNPSVVSFIFQTKETIPSNTTRQIQIAHYAAQYHLRNLGFSDGYPLFGLFLSEEDITFHISYWEEGSLIVRPVLKRLVPRHLEDYFELYFLVCRLSEYQLSRFQAEVERWKSDPRSHLQLVQSRLDEANSYLSAIEHRRRRVVPVAPALAPTSGRVPVPEPEPERELEEIANLPRSNDALTEGNVFTIHEPDGRAVRQSILMWLEGANPPCPDPADPDQQSLRDVVHPEEEVRSVDSPAAPGEGSQSGTGPIASQRARDDRLVGDGGVHAAVVGHEEEFISVTIEAPESEGDTVVS